MLPISGSDASDKRKQNIHLELNPNLFSNKTGGEKNLLFAVRTGLEPVTSCVTGRHSNQLN